jgi:hypothetical protein
MRGIFPYFVLIGAIIALGALALSRRRPPSIEHNPVRCSNCETLMSPRRVPMAKSHALLGGVGVSALPDAHAQRKDLYITLWLVIPVFWDTDALASCEGQAGESKRFATMSRVRPPGLRSSKLTASRCRTRPLFSMECSLRPLLRLFLRFMH